MIKSQPVRFSVAPFCVALLIRLSEAKPLASTVIAARFLAKTLRMTAGDRDTLRLKTAQEK